EFSGFGGFAVAPDGKTVAVLTAAGLVLYELTGGKFTESRRHAVRRASSVGYTPDGAALIVTGNDDYYAVQGWVRFLDPATGQRAAALAGDSFIDLPATAPRLPAAVRDLLADPAARRAAAEAAASPRAVKYPAAAAKLLPPVPDPGKILCIGLNYRDHAIEGGKAIPSEPVLFAKFPNTLIAHGDPIKLPKVAQKVDYEAELVIVIGRRGKHIPNDAAAFQYVGGYTCGHDVSAR